LLDHSFLEKYALKTNLFLTIKHQSALNMHKIILISVFTLAFVISGRCEDGKTIFESKCAACHSKDGSGQTKMGQKLAVRDLSDAKVQAALKDEDISKAIKEGVKKEDKVVMKGFGDKLSDDDVKALVTHVRSLKK
jgi:cytochrome c553